MTQRQRPNAWECKYYQWVLAGKIAEARGEMKDEIESANNPNSIYRDNNGSVSYSVLGQEYLRRLGIDITPLV